MTFLLQMSFLLVVGPVLGKSRPQIFENFEPSNLFVHKVFSQIPSRAPLQVTKQAIPVNLPNVSKRMCKNEYDDLGVCINELVQRLFAEIE